MYGILLLPVLSTSLNTKIPVDLVFEYIHKKLNTWRVTVMLIHKNELHDHFQLIETF